MILPFCFIHLLTPRLCVKHFISTCCCQTSRAFIFLYC